MTIVDDASRLRSAAVTGKAAVLVAGSVVPATLGTVLNTVSVPVVMANTTVAANMGLTGSVSGTDHGTTTGQTQVTLTPAGSLHATGGGLTAGTTGTSTVAESIGWAKPATGAVTTATLTGDSSKATVFSYEAGSAMITGTAPARRVGFFPTNGTANATGQVAQLFDAAVGWEANTTPVVSYIRDASDRIVARKINGTITAKYSFTATGDTADITLDAAGNLVEATTVLTGGALWTSRPGGTDVWSYPNIHGDLVATADSTGVKQGATRVYDPFGSPLGSSTIPDNSAGGMDYGWHGQQQRPAENQPGVLSVIEMGARQYSPALGRFLEVDPIEGGVDNDYTYPTDAVNKSDLDGLCGVWGNPWKKCGKKHKGQKGFLGGGVSKYSKSISRGCYLGSNPNGSCRVSRQVWTASAYTSGALGASLAATGCGAATANPYVTWTCGAAGGGWAGTGKGGALGGTYRSFRYVARGMSSCGDISCDIGYWKQRNPGKTPWDE